MTEYELTDSMQSVSSNIWAAEAIFLTVLSAYVVVAFTAGSRLSSYQYVFVNTVFLLTVFTNSLNTQELMSQTLHFGSQLQEYSSDYVDSLESEFARFSIWLVYGRRALLTIGALIFMWSVRHPKTE